MAVKLEYFQRPSFLLLVFTLIVVLAVFASSQLIRKNVREQGAGQTRHIAFYNSGQMLAEIDAEVAETSEQRKKGLMFRQTLSANAGMLFIFPREQDLSFWMKNTYIPLDMLFLDKNKNIVSIIKNAEPCQADPCPSYSSSNQSQYVIEVNVGFTTQHNITPITTVVFD